MPECPKRGSTLAERVAERPTCGFILAKSMPDAQPTLALLPPLAVGARNCLRFRSRGLVASLLLAVLALACAKSQRAGKTALLLIEGPAAECDQAAHALNGMWSSDLASGDFRDTALAIVVRDQGDRGVFAAADTALSLVQEPLRLAAQDERFRSLLDYYGEAKRLCGIARDPTGYNQPRYSQAADEAHTQLAKLRIRLDVLLPLAPGEAESLLKPYKDKIEAARKAAIAEADAREKAQAEEDSKHQAEWRKDAPRNRAEQEQKVQAARTAHPWEWRWRQAEEQQAVVAWLPRFEVEVRPIKEAFLAAVHRRVDWTHATPWRPGVDPVPPREKVCYAFSLFGSIKAPPSGDSALDEDVSRWLTANRLTGEACDRSDFVAADEMQKAALHNWRNMVNRLGHRGLEP